VKYLVDANILSEPTKPAPDPRAVGWLRANESNIAIDAVILGELRFGILLLPKGKKRATLEQWFAHGIGRLQCLPWTADTALHWASLLARLRSAGKNTCERQLHRGNRNPSQPDCHHPQCCRFPQRRRARHQSIPQLTVLHRNVNKSVGGSLAVVAREQR
jgi:predicted nucleic acid-binding protein